MMTPVRTLSVAGAGLAMMLVAGCRSHVQDEGTYAFTATEVLRDDCQLLGTSAALWDGTFSLHGDTVQMVYGLEDAHLAGNYREDSEQFELDGTVGQVTRQVENQQCLLDQIDVHLDALTDSPNRFHGTLDVFYEASRPETCVCKLWVTFNAVKK